MEKWIIISTVLGLVQGLAEFLPISSTAHLIIVGKFLDFTGVKASVFEVAVQLGSILAVIVIYWKIFLSFIFPNQEKNFTGIQGIWLLFLTTLPAGIVGFILHKYIKMLFIPQYIIIALITGSLFILLGESIQKKTPIKAHTLDDITPKIALYIGFFQCLALWPGFSRSAATIIGGMLLGCKRKLAIEYSFIAAVPIMVAATGYDILKNWSLMSINDIPFFSLGMFSAFIAAWFVMKAFFNIITTMNLQPFAYYRFIIAILVYVLIIMKH